MSASEIPEEDLKVIKKYTKEKILRQFSKEESLQQPKKDLFSIALALIVSCIFITIYFLDRNYYNNIDYYNNIILFVPLILVFSVIIFGHYYGKTLHYQIFFLIFFLPIILAIEFVYIYISFNYRGLIPALPVNTFAFIFISSMGIFTGYAFSLFVKVVFIEDTDNGNSENFSIEVLSHTDNLESYEGLIKTYIKHVLDLKMLPSYDIKGKKIIQKAGLNLNDTFLLYVILGNIFSFFIFSKKGRYIYQDNKSIEIQKKISFVLKNSLNFKDVSEEQRRTEAKENCLNLLTQYEINNLTKYIGFHKKQSIGLILLITLIFIVYISYPLNIILQGLSTIISNTIVPQIFILLVTALFFWFIGKQNKE